MQSQMRSRYRFLDEDAAYFITSTTLQWLPIFTTAAYCQLIADSFGYCQQHKGLKVYAWVVLDNHFHAIVAGPDLSRSIADLKKFTARAILGQLKLDGRDWLLNQLAYYCGAHKRESEHQVWQEGSHPQAIVGDDMMRQKLDYLHNNPVKRGLVCAPEHWRYSSAHVWLAGALPVLRVDAWR